WSRVPGIAAYTAPMGQLRVRQFSVQEASLVPTPDIDIASEVHVLREKINDSVKAAMKAQDKARVGTLRLVNAAIKNADIEAERAGKPALSDEDVLGLLQKMIKQRQESIALYDQGGRKELADQERSEIEIIKGFLPQQLSEAEAKEAVAAAIKETGAAGLRDMGKVMAVLRERHAGRMDFGKASGQVKSLLSGV